MKVRSILLHLLMCLFLVSSVIALAACNPPETEPKYTVTYASGASDAEGETPEVQSYEEGAKITLLSSDVFTREGHTFVSWSDGSQTYAAGASYTMPAHNVTFTAQWTSNGGTGGGEDEDEDEDDVPEISELDAKFYNASNWVYMTNDGGTSTDIGEVPYSLSDGSIKFHRANQAIEIGDYTNSTVSFMLKGTNDWSIWFNSSSKDNSDNSSYRLAYAYGGLRIALSSEPESAAAAIVNTDYKKGEWNRFDLVFSANDGVCEIKVYVNGVRADLAVSALVDGVTVENNVMRHEQPAGFVTGNYMAVKVWEANNYVQIKPVAEKDAEDDPIVACIGASITEGAGADNFYTESYPAQLQQALGNEYNVLNFGNSGKTVRTDLKGSNGESVAWLDQPQWEGVRAIVPDIAIINMGTNDSKTSNDPATTTENFEAAFRNLLDQLLAVNPDMEIYICTVPYAYTDIWDINNDNIRDIIAPVQRKLAEEYGCTLIDLYEYSQGKSMLFGDGVHPNTSGYAMFVEIIEKAVTEGASALTDEFIKDINARYNDVVSGFTAEVAESGDKVELIVSGDTILPDGSGIVKVYVGTGDDNAEYYPATVSAGKFTATIELNGLDTGSGWYNVRIYAEGGTALTDYDGSGYHILLMDETEYSAGEIFAAGKCKITLQSWNSNWGSTFSFSVGENKTAQITSSVITEKDGKLTLSVEGISDDEELQLYVGEHPTKEGVYRKYVPVTFGGEGKFTVDFDLSSMPVGTGWYNVRLYFSDGSYAVVPLAQTTDGTDSLKTGDVFYCENTKIEIVSWSDGGVGTLSFNVSEYDGTFVPEVEITSSSIVTEDGKILLTVSGTTNDEGIRLYVGSDEEETSYYHVITVQDGKFEVEFDLTTLATGSGWYNVRIYYNEEFYEAGNTEYETILYTSTVDGTGEPVEVDDVFHTDSISVTIKTWGNYGLLSLLVEEYSEPEPEVASVTISEIKFENGYFVVTGTAQNVTDLDIYLINTNVAASINNFVQAQLGEDGSFTVRLPLATIAGYGQKNIPFNLRYTIEDGETINIPQGSLDLSQVYTYGEYKYTISMNNGCVAVKYNSHGYKYTITNAEIKEVDGKAMLIIEGTTEDESISYSSLSLLLDYSGKLSGSDIKVSNSATKDGVFQFSVDISDLAGAEDMTVNTAERYFIRLYNGEERLADINSSWVSDKLFEEVRIGDSVYCFCRNNANAYYTLGIIRMNTVQD